MTSKVVGEGTYGCVLKPPLKCISNKKMDYNDKVSKIMLDYDAKNEENEYANINNIKGLDKYAITGPTYCKPLVNKDFNDSVKNCKNKDINETFHKRKQYLSMLLLQDGGINIHDFIVKVFPKQTLNEKKIFLTSLINLFDGLLFFQSNNIIHRDIKPGNIFIDQLSSNNIQHHYRAIRVVSGHFEPSKVQIEVGEAISNRAPW